MRTITAPAELDVFLKRLRQRGRGVSPKIEKAVRAIINDVMLHGDAALKRLTRKFDGHDNVVLPQKTIKRYAGRADKKVLRAMELSAGRIRSFHERQKERSWSFKEDGIELGQVIGPIGRAGIYVPGGRASYPSTVLMNVIPAQVAGVEEIALTVPTPGGEINPEVMAAIDLLGVKEVYSIGGAQAVAALAYGTETIRRADKITGPGNIYVATAKRMVFGEVGIDMIAGPSEVLIIADGKANPAFAASDLLSQAEHDELASAVLITTSSAFAKTLKEELLERLNKSKRKSIAATSIKNYGAVIIVKSLKEAARIADLIAPEHLEIMTERPKETLRLIHNAGAAFLGDWSPEPLGDYSAGPNHTLPTGGTARFSSPLGVYDFIKRTSLINFSRRGFLSLADAVETLAMAEGLEAHANAVRVRKKAGQ